MTQTNKGFMASTKKPSHGAQRCLASATMGVTVALEEARKRGFLSRHDTVRMSRAEVNSYIDLAQREWGISQWENEGN